MPSSPRESSPPENIATQISVSRWLVAANGGLAAARAGGPLREGDRRALGMLRDALRSAADQQSIVAISGDLGLASTRDVACLVEALGDDDVPVLESMVEALTHAEQGTIQTDDADAIDRVRHLLLILSELRLAQARNVSHSDPVEPWWPTALSSAS
jgi:hypothetical protein